MTNRNSIQQGHRGSVECQRSDSHLFLCHFIFADLGQVI